MTILVISYETDGHAHHVLQKAKERGIDSILVDPRNYPGEIGISYSPSTGSTTITLSNKTIRDTDVSGIWMRRMGSAEVENSHSMSAYISRESEVVMRSLNEILGNINWISDPEQTRLANRKPVQLKHAHELGWKIPVTCITNSPDEAETFIRDNRSRPLTMKPVGSAFVQLSDDKNKANPNNKVIFTRLVNPDLLLRNIRLVKNCPIILQEAIVKTEDIRVTVIDNNVFATGIQIQDCEDEANLDWRNYEGRRTYSRHELPEAVRKLCIAITRSLGLRMGCIDLGYSPVSGYTFFEINPQGQWLPSELELGYNISGTLLDCLVL